MVGTGLVVADPGAVTPGADAVDVPGVGLGALAVGSGAVGADVGLTGDTAADEGDGGPSTGGMTARLSTGGRVPVRLGGRPVLPGTAPGRAGAVGGAGVLEGAVAPLAAGTSAGSPEVAATRLVLAGSPSTDATATAPTVSSIPNAAPTLAALLTRGEVWRTSRTTRIATLTSTTPTPRTSNEVVPTRASRATPRPVRTNTPTTRRAAG